MSNAILHSSQYQNYRRIDLIVIHCSATRATQRYTVDDCRRDHRARGFADIGYHYNESQSSLYGGSSGTGCCVILRYS